MENAMILESFDFNSTTHCDALVYLLNEYITDKMGGGEPHTEKQKTELIRGLEKHPSKLVYLAREGNHFVGLIIGFINFATFSVKPFINIHDIIVTSDWRNKGVGRKLLEQIMKVAADMDCSKVTLEVREDNVNAQALYKSLGFRDAEPRQFYWSKYL